MLLILFKSMLFAGTFVIAKHGLFYARPIFFIGIRMLLAGSLMVGYLVLCDRSKIRLTYKDLPLLCAVAFVHIYLSYVCEFLALNYLTAAKACVMYNLSPFIAALISQGIFKEQMTGRKWAGIIIGCAAFVPIILVRSSLIELYVGGIGYLSWPELSMLVAVVSAVLGWALVRLLTAPRYSYSIIWLNGFSMMVGGLSALVTSRFFEGVQPVSAWKPFIPWLALIVFSANILGYNLYAYLLRQYTLTFLSFTGLMTPLFAAFWGWLFLYEHIHWSFFITVLGVAIGLYLFYKEELKQGYIKSSEYQL